MSRLPSRPLPNFSCLRRAMSSDLELDNGLMFFSLGRDALVYGLELLEIEPGATILIPAYMCNSTIEPLRNLGYEIIFFDVEKDLNYDLDMVESLISASSVKAILSVHYFGFPCEIENLVELCKRYDVRVIEDCSHSYLTQISDRSVGSFGDMAIYSMRKTLATPDGGALKLNVDVPPIAQAVGQKVQWVGELIYVVSRMVEAIICFIGFPNLYSNRIDRVKNIARDIRTNQNGNGNAMRRVIPIRASFQLKAYLHDRNYTAFIMKKRRHNYTFLVQETEKLGFKVFCPQLLDGCIPQHFILLDEQQKLATWMREQGIGAVTWPGSELPLEVSSAHVDFPTANYLNNNLVMLPIHQSLSDKQCKSIVTMLGKWIRSK